MPHRRIITIWQTLEEPRAVTAITVVVYGLAATVGVLIATNSAWAGIDNPGTHLASVGLLVIGGIVGVPTCWRGVWWAERIATLAIGGGALVLAGNVLAIVPSVWPLVALFSALSLGFLATRYIRVRLAPFAPGKGPMLPSQEAALDAATDPQ